MAPIIVAVFFLYAILCLLTQLKYWRSYKNVLPIKQLLYYGVHLLPGLELYVRYDWLVIDSSKHHNLFPIHFMHAYTHNTKSPGHIRMFYMSKMTAPLSKMSIFCVRAECEIWFSSYGSKHAAHSFSGMPFFCPYTHNLKTIGHMWMICISNDCSSVEDILCVV